MKPDDERRRSWPRTVEAAASELLDGLSPSDRDRIAAMDERGLIRLHHGWGTGIRNRFGLWSGNSELIESCIELGGPGVRHPDDASGVIIKAVWNRLKGFAPDYHQWLVHDTVPCRSCGSTMRQYRWRDGEVFLPVEALCVTCVWRGSPEYAQRERENERARAAFEHARRLGEEVHRRYVASGGAPEAPDDDLLSWIVRDGCKRDPAFRELWYSARGRAFGRKDVSWLRLWCRL